MGNERVQGLGGLRGYLSRNLRGRKGQRGFTLIELLVVVTILGVLAAIVTLSLVGLTTNATVQSCNQEYKTVQSALDAYMANNNLSAISASGAFTNDMTGASNGGTKLYNATPTATNPNYTRNGITQFFYNWDTTGQITGISASSGGATVSGCIPH